MPHSIRKRTGEFHAKRFFLGSVPKWDRLELLARINKTSWTSLLQPAVGYSGSRIGVSACTGSAGLQARVQGQEEKNASAAEVDDLSG